MVKKYKKTKKTKKYSKKTKVMKGGANGKYKGPDPHIRYGAPPTTKYVAPPPTTKYGEGPTKYVEATPPKWIKSGENWVKNPAAEVMIKPTPPIVAETATRAAIMEVQQGTLPSRGRGRRRDPGRTAAGKQSMTTGKVSAAEQVSKYRNTHPGLTYREAQLALGHIFNI